MHKFMYQTNILNSSNLDLKLELLRFKVESTERKVKRLKLEDIFLVFSIKKAEMIDKREKIFMRMK